MFNDYMNCLWTQQSEGACRSLIEAAARAGGGGLLLRRRLVP